MIKISDKTQCCGCSSCAETCPVNCIKMVEDNEGFLFPQVDTSACINCGACEKVCPIIQADCVDAGEIAGVFEQPKTIGGWIKDDSIRADSSSGGAFSLFANYILENKGIVFGASLCEDMVVRHIFVEKPEDLTKLRGSKHSQSVIGNIYSQVKKSLDDGRLVLFSGTPCQAAGLCSYLGNRKYDNLYVIDFICHGIPSPKVFASYIAYMEDKVKDKIVGFKFRSKDKKWHPMGLSFGDGTIIKTASGNTVRQSPGLKDPYMMGFLDDTILRDSCYECRFKVVPKYYSDFTIADFWGVNKSYPELFDGKGTSLVFLNSERGYELFKKLKDYFFYKEVDYNKVSKRNPSLTTSVKKNSRRKSFFRDFEKKPFSKLIWRYMSPFSWFIHKSLGTSWKIIQGIIRVVVGRGLKILHITWSEENWNSFFQFVKFAMIGVSNVAVSYTINVSTLLLQRVIVPGFHFDYIVANVTAFLLSVLWSFHWNSRKVFGVNDSFSAKFKALMKSYMSYAFTGLILNNLMSTFWIHVVGVSKFISPLLNLPISMPVNFFILKKWAFRKEKKVSDGDK
ncbi:Coenzyme F420 hydrogenase/dehydrogenase, beta subunit C-terminal domain [Pseudobutyrivibrio xylanivorans]|uniref:4Fe-4S dicluster domain-containing protein n=1 Tax=Pseudobutyrivibrio xylanivorans DSM 14809 TaxID=1123012 RepID=A0A1M6JQ54_PSEXY|nr:Coenzyme F420 hydrogenase/dehydrogenase, beta subunit C-terminal domain [Pseudobutyrivibrio xylanivorans]SHJ48855.1 4Fe-4S dicluster domain-containing protein [Pseudobutyrivibrio xylanivorans DSM 14809]